MKYLYILLCLVIFLPACIDDLKELPENSFDSGESLIRIVNGEFINIGRLEVVFETDYDLLTAAEKNLLTGMVVFRNGEERFSFEVDRTFFIDANLAQGEAYCYNIVFEGKGSFSRASNTLCFEY